MRRKTRRTQRGGAQAQSLETWLDAVNAHRNSLRDQVGTAKGVVYAFSTLQDEELTIPKQKYKVADDPTSGTEYDSAFELPMSGTPIRDLRSIALGIQIIMSSFIPKPIAEWNSTDFETYVASLRVQRADEAVVDTTELNHLLRAENAMRKEPITDITDTENYPLYIWYSVMNVSGSVDTDAVPILSDAPPEVTQPPPEPDAQGSQ